MDESKSVSRRKRDGFNGQKAIVLPHKVVEDCGETKLVHQLFITDIGFYPKAKFHYRERYIGVGQNILIYCINGKGWLDLKKKEYPVYPGQFLIIPANVVHKYGSEEKDPWTIFWLHLKGVSQIISTTGYRKILFFDFNEEKRPCSQ